MTPCPPTTAHLETVRAGLARERLRTVCSRAGVSSDTRVTFSPSAMVLLSSAVLLLLTGVTSNSSSLVTTTTVKHGNTQLWFQSVDLKSDKVRNVETGDKRRTVNTEYLFPCCVSRVYTVHTIDQAVPGSAGVCVLSGCLLPAGHSAGSRAGT